MNLKHGAILEQDLVLVYIENKPAFFARVEKITPDVKPKWWRVKFLTLTLPLKMITWIIDDEQIRGVDFTIGGTLMRIEKVVPPKELEEPSEAIEQKVSGEDGEEGVSKKARVLSFRTNTKKN